MGLVDHQKQALKELRDKRIAYKTLFDSIEGKVILKDLEMFCKVHTSSYVGGDPYGTVLNEGKRLVYLRIKKFISSTEEELKSVAYKTAITE